MTSIGRAFARGGHELFSLALRAASSGLALPRTRRNQLGDEEGPRALWHWIEDNSSFVFPIIGVVILALVIVAVRRSSVNQDALLIERRNQKDSIVRLMRAKLSLTADQTAGELGVDRYHAAALLEELVQEGALVQGRLPGGVISYRLKGL